MAGLPSSSPSSSSPPATSELLKLSQEYMERVEKYVETVTKAVNNAEKMRIFFLEEKNKLKTSTFQRSILILKVLVPFIPLAFLMGLFILPCGINWDGFGMKFSTTACVATKHESQKNTSKE